MKIHLTRSCLASSRPSTSSGTGLWQGQEQWVVTTEHPGYHYYCFFTCR